MDFKKRPKKHLLAEKLREEYYQTMLTNMNKVKNNLNSFNVHLDHQYGERGTESREKYEEEFEIFKFGVLLQELRKAKGMTQEQLAQKCGTTKNYISRIENNASDIRLSTLLKILREGFGRTISISVS